MVADRVELVTRKAGAHAGVRWESHRRGHLHDRRRAGRAAGHLGHPAPQARGHRGRAGRLRQPGHRPRASSSATRTSSPGRSGWRQRRDRRAPRRTTSRLPSPSEVINSRKALWARPQSEVSEEEYTEFYRHVSHDWQRAAGDDPAVRRGHLRVPGAAVPAQPRADRPVHARRQARRAALRQARVHHGRLRGARPGVPALRQGRRRRERPVAQHLPRDPPAGPADPADPQAAGQEGAVDGQDDAAPTSRRSTRRSGPSSAARSRKACSPTTTTATRSWRSARSRRRTTPRSRPRCATTSPACPRARTRSTTPPASPGRRWRTRRTWRRSAPRATRCCC